MKRILLSAIIVIGVAGIYFTVQQKDELSRLIGERRTLEMKVSSQKIVLGETEEEREKAEEAAGLWNKTRGEKTSLVANEQDKNDGLVKERDELLAQSKKSKDEYEKIQNEIAAYDFKDPQEVVDRNNSANEKNKEIKASLEEVKLLVEAENKKTSEAENHLMAYQRRQQELKDKAVANAKQFTVTAVEPQWGFVVVNGGADTHITPESTLLVSRKGKSIAKLKITSLEKRQTVADVVEGSLSAGNRVEVGDTVLLLTPQG